MKSLVKIVAVAVVMFSVVEGHSAVRIESASNNAVGKQLIVNTCPIYPTCKEGIEVGFNGTNKSIVTNQQQENAPLIANTCPIYPTCRENFESELA